MDFREGFRPRRLSHCVSVAPGIFKAFAKNGEERNKKKKGQERMSRERDRDWMRNTLARITQLAYAGFMDFDTASDEESDCRIRSALRQIGQLLINRGVSGVFDLFVSFHIGFLLFRYRIPYQIILTLYRTIICIC